MTTIVTSSLSDAVKESHRQFLENLQTLNNAKTNNQLSEVFNLKDANSVYIIMYSLRKIYKRDLFNPATLSSLMHNRVSVDWDIVPDNVVDDEIRCMIGGLISVTQFDDYCRFVGALQNVLTYENNVTSSIENLPLSLNSFLYLMPPNVDSMQFGQVASLYLNDAVIGELGAMYPYVTKFAARNRKMLYMGQMPQLLELRETGIMSTEADGDGIQYNFYGKFPPYLVLLELQTLGRFDVVDLIYGGDDSGESALVYLQTLLIGMSVGKDEASLFEGRMIDAANELGLEVEVGIYPVGADDYLTEVTLNNPTAKVTKLPNPDGTQMVRISGKNYTLVPE